jgi:hypothetical protein
VLTIRTFWAHLTTVHPTRSVAYVVDVGDPYIAI